MNIAVLGTGVVGSTIGGRLVQDGHRVRMGSRTADNARAAEWVAKNGPDASQGTFADAAAFGEVVFNCTHGVSSLDALRSAGRENLAGKILIDVANALDFSRGMPPTLTVCNTESLGELIQREFPDTRVVKTLNTMNCFLMVNPAQLPGDHTVFVSGDDEAARGQVARWLEDWFGWNERGILDLGDITTARGTEMLLPLWVRLWGKLQNPNFNFGVVVGPPPAK